LIPKVRGLIVNYDDSIVSMTGRQETEIQKRFGVRLRQLRKDKGFSQESLALAADIDRTYIGGVERGERNISLKNIHKIARALGVPVRELFNA
jgi:DNA-binding XRE family transcriptional regulator